MSRQGTYQSWSAMKQRCRVDPYYVGRISICQEWSSFEAFHRDMGDRPDGYTLDRINGDLGYSKENCRWATWSAQQMNRRKFKNGKLASIGVGFKEGRFVARLYANKKCYTLGGFDSEDEASLAYQSARDRWERLGLVRYF